MLGSSFNCASTMLSPMFAGAKQQQQQQPRRSSTQVSPPGFQSRSFSKKRTAGAAGAAAGAAAPLDACFAFKRLICFRALHLFRVSCSHNSGRSSSRGSLRSERLSVTNGNLPLHPIVPCSRPLHRAVATTLPAPECFTHRAISVANIWMRRIDCEAFGSNHPFPERSSVRMRARSSCAPRIIPGSGCKGELHADHAPRGVLRDSFRQGFCSGPVALNTEASYCAADNRWAGEIPTQSPEDPAWAGALPEKDFH